MTANVGHTEQPRAIGQLQQVEIVPGDSRSGLVQARQIQARYFNEVWAKMFLNHPGLFKLPSALFLSVC